jgi:alpha-glucosidase (family GH31 glycosyl hydrolase)
MGNQAMKVELLLGELWWGGIINSHYPMPYAPGATVDLRDLNGNCGMPLLISNLGRYVWCEEPFRFTLTAQHLDVTSYEDAPISFGDGYGTLRDVYRYVSRTYFPTRGTAPDERFFLAPQYNTWMEMTYFSTQERVIEYAENILAHGFPPGILIIDTLWHPTYGTWIFDRARYPDAKGMVSRLNEMGFQVMLWLVPYITPDTVTFRELRDQGFLLRKPDGEPIIMEWWDGFGAGLDVTNPAAVAWLHEQLDILVHVIGIRGFKLDGGQPIRYAEYGIANPHHVTQAWNKIGLRYPMAEYKDSWKCAGWPLAQRIRDRNHRWDRPDGLGSLIPMGLAQGLLGYTFNCPDMIGGGECQDLPAIQGGQFDPELFVRYAQVAALFPMMQFSLAPWRLLDADSLSICVRMANLHTQMGNEIYQLAVESAQNGEPIMRHLAYSYPQCGYEKVDDQFLLGEDILVAPVVIRGARSRRVVFPPGVWRGEDGSLVSGPCTQEVDAPLSRLPWYRRE